MEGAHAAVIPHMEINSELHPRVISLLPRRVVLFLSNNLGRRRHFVKWGYRLFISTDQPLIAFLRLAHSHVMSHVVSLRLSAGEIEGERRWQHLLLAPSRWDFRIR